VYGFADELQTISVPILESVYNELKALGTFTDYDAKPSANPDLPAKSIERYTVSDKDLQLLETKIQVINEQVAGLKQRLDELTHLRNDHDEIVIELLKMLKDNLDKRLQLILQIDEPKIRTKISENKMDSRAKTSPESSKVSSLKSHKRKA
jgi:hypothetical protein